MNVAYKYSNDNIYIRPMLNREEDKANILLARADWRADGVVPTAQFDDMFPTWVDQMNETWKSAGMIEDTKAEAIRVGIPTETNSILSRSFYPDPFYLIEMIYEKSTDNFVGFTKTWCNGSTAEHIVTSFHLDQRGKGYHDDYSILSGKAWFIYSGGDVAVHYTPRGQASYYVADPNKEIAKTRWDRIDSVDYIENKFTKAEYTAWMDLPANQADRDASFTIERYLEV